MKKGAANLRLEYELKQNCKLEARIEVGVEMETGMEWCEVERVVVKCVEGEAGRQCSG